MRRPRDVLFLALFVLPIHAGAAAPQAPQQRIAHGVATERVVLDDGAFAHAWSFDIRRTVDVGLAHQPETVRFGNARRLAQGEAALDQGDPQWGGLVGWTTSDPSSGPMIDDQERERAVARVKQGLGPQAGVDDPVFEEVLDLLAQFEVVARWKSWVGLWQPDATRAGWWAALGGGAPASIATEVLAEGGQRRVARYRIDAAAPPQAVPLGSGFWLALELRDPAHPLLHVATPLDVAVVEVATFAAGADWPSRVEVERRLGPDPQGRHWTVRQELTVDWRAADAPEPPPLSGDSPWIEHAAPAADASGNREPYYRHSRPPVYPPTSRAAKFSGSIVLRVALDAEGRPTQVTPKSSTSVPELDDAAVAAVREWRFWPRLEAGQAVPAELLVPVAFRLRDAAAPADAPR